MTTIELYKFVNETPCEYHWIDYKPDVILFVDHWNIKGWMDLLGSHILGEAGLECHMREGYFCFMMQDICDNFNIDINEIFKKEE